MRKIGTYIRTHLWCAIAGAIIGFLLLYFGLMQTYLKQEYANYLKDQTYAKVGVMISSVSNNLQVILRDFIQIGSEVSVDQELYSYIEQYVNEPDLKVSNRRMLQDEIKGYIYYSKWIEGICIASIDGRIYQYDRTNNTNKKLWNDENQEVLMNMGKRILSLVEESRIPRYTVSSSPHYHPIDSDKELFHLVYPVRGLQNYDKVKYFVVISFNEGVIGEFLDTFNQNNPDVEAAYITDKNGRIIYHSNKVHVGKQLEQYVKEKDLNNFSTPIGKLDWNLNISINERALLLQVNNIYYRGIMIYALLMLFLCGILFIVINGILRPVRAIGKSIRQVKNGNLQAQIPIKGYHEIWQLAEAYNKMIQSLIYMNRQAEMHHKEKLLYIKKKQAAEREALESQINAHFICNTLGVINYEAMESGNHKISVLIKKLSNILRYTFNQKNQNVYLYQEIAWIEQYLFLQKSRMEDSMDYSISLSGEIENWPCRKLMLQPFVENSILHGFEGIEEGGFLAITGSLEEDKLKLVIEDNGRGMCKERKELIQKILSNPMEADESKVGIGISNVVTRMRMYYGDNLNIQLETEKGEGTRITFYIPQPIDSNK